MAKTKFTLERPELSIAEATKQCSCPEAELFYRAEIGQLTIYVLTENWEAHHIYNTKISNAIIDGLNDLTGTKTQSLPDSEWGGELTMIFCTGLYPIVSAD